ncbi:MAG: hypothetical protein MUP14_03885 [Dehalococcoidia bacterium]|nr:hypothetical protein [Dehalococcoidia bacterium]
MDDATDPARCLALAVIGRAVSDLTLKGEMGLRTKARSWLLGDSKALQFWCAASDIDQGALRDRVLEVVPEEEKPEMQAAAAQR